MTDFLREGPPQGSAEAWTPPGTPSPPPGAPAPHPQQSMYATSPAAVWGPPQNEWSQQPPKKRKAWPWILGVVGVVGGLVVLGGAVAALLFGIDDVLNSDHNDNYTGSPIAAGDAPTRGDQLIVSPSGSVAFDIGAEWIDPSTLSGSYSTVMTSPDGATLVATYYAIDSTTPDRFFPTVIYVLEGKPPGQVGPIDLAANHERFVAANVDGLRSPRAETTTSEARPVTTANGLDGSVTGVSSEYEGSWMSTYKYTFVRSQRVVHVEIVAYTEAFDDATASLVTDSLRIDE